MTGQEFLSLITLLNAKIWDRHTMFLLSEAALDYNRTSGRFLPLFLAYIDRRKYIIENCSRD